MATGIENLKIYTMATELELQMYTILKNFPSEEKFRSLDQLSRSSSSVPNNIAEAYYKRSAKERVHILRDVVIGELEETRTNLIRCGKKNFLDIILAQKIDEKYTELKKAIFGYIRFIKSQKALE